MSGSFNTLSGATLFQGNSVTGAANDVEVDNLLVDGDCTILGTLYANVPINAAGTTTGAVQLRSSAGTITASDNLVYNTTTNVLTTPQLFVTGNSQIGDVGADILTVNSTSQFNNDVIVGSSSTDIFNVNSTATFQNNVQIGSNNTDILNINSLTNFNFGFYRMWSAQPQIIIGSTTTGVSMANPLPFCTSIVVTIKDFKTASTTIPPHVRILSNSFDASLLYGSCSHSNGTTKLWNQDRIYLWADTWSTSITLQGFIKFEFGGVNLGQSIWFISYNLSNSASGSVSVGAGSIILDGSLPPTVGLNSSGGVNISNGSLYNAAFM